MSKSFGYILVLLSLFFVLSCDKTKRTRKKLDGQWTILSYEYLNPSGLTYKYSAQGSFTFNDSSNDELSSFTIDMNYEGPSGTTPFYEEGYYVFNQEDHEYLDLYRVNADTITDTVPNARILLITKDDLMFEYLDSQGRKTFVMAK